MSPTLTKPPIGPKWAVPPQGEKGWGATVDYDSWDDPYTPKDKLAVHYEGGPQPVNELDEELRAQLEDLIRQMPERPKFRRHPWRWWRWFKSPEFLAQVEREKAVARGVERYHLSKPWRGAAYSGFIGPSGTFFRIRGMNNTGAHFSNDDIDYDGISENREAYAVMLMMGGGQEPTLYAWRTLKRIRRYVQREMGVKIMPFGHQEIAWSGGHNTSCPGVPLMQRIVRKWGTLKQRLAKTGLELPLKP
jgi:hypothetical protein